MGTANACVPLRCTVRSDVDSVRKDIISKDATSKTDIRADVESDMQC